ncbi:MAG: hydroxymethylbilane synthase [FCB group bacterium]|nr:hydroxymethylbilane synthase [FCB group bacterium]
MNEIVIGTRGSQLALWQANFIKSKLEETPGVSARLNIIKTRGDKIDHLSFDKIEGKGFFTKEIEDALLAEEVDLAVHSLKDLMTTMPPGLALGAAGFRADNREAVLIRKESFDPDRILKIKEGGVTGSSSVRRQCQITHLAPDLALKELRGNVPTRINKLRDGQYDAIILAQAGISRLEINLSDLEVFLLDEDKFLPAPGQGILGIQIREGDRKTAELISSFDDQTARIQTDLERGLLARFEGGCQLPLGVFSSVDGKKLGLTAVLGLQKDGHWIGLAKSSVTGENPDRMIEEVYEDLSSQKS